MFRWSHRKSKKRRGQDRRQADRTHRAVRRFRRLTLEFLEDRQLLSGIPLPQLLQDANPGINGSSPGNFVALEGMTYFTANGTELWRTNGTTAGTSLVKNIDPGLNRSLDKLVVMNGQLVIGLLDNGGTSYDLTDDRLLALWKSNGTTAGTVLVKSFGVGSSVVDGTAYFTAVPQASGPDLGFAIVNDGVNGAELWVSDLTSAGTTMVKDINPTAGGSAFYNMFTPAPIAFNNSLYFNADDGTRGNELWKSNGNGSWQRDGERYPAEHGSL